MIGKLLGTIQAIHEDSLLVMTSGGVGYFVSCPASFAVNCKVGCEIDLFIETIVKEDSIALFGFRSYQELVWFRSFLKVSGIGARLGLAILSTLSIREITFAIDSGNKDFFTQVSGLGEKIAGRIITEMKKEPKKNAKILMESILAKPEEGEPEESHGSFAEDGRIADAILALEGLGFGRNATFPIVLRIVQESPEASLIDIIKLSLRALH